MLKSSSTHGCCIFSVAFAMFSLRFCLFVSKPSRFFFACVFVVRYGASAIISSTSSSESLAPNKSSNLLLWASSDCGGGRRLGAGVDVEGLDEDSLGNRRLPLGSGVADAEREYVGSGSLRLVIVDKLGCSLTTHSYVTSSL